MRQVLRVRGFACFAGFAGFARSLPHCPVWHLEYSQQNLRKLRRG